MEKTKNYAELLQQSKKIDEHLKDKPDMKKIWYEVKVHKQLFTNIQLYEKLLEMRELRREKYHNLNEKNAFDESYHEVFGKEKYITGFKKLIGSLMHIFDEDKKKENVMQIQQELLDDLSVTEKLYDTFGKKIIHVFDGLVKKFTNLENGVVLIYAIDKAIDDILKYNRIGDEKNVEKYTNLFQNIAYGRYDQEGNLVKKNQQKKENSY